jgi:hypothetical protein
VAACTRALTWRPTLKGKLAYGLVLSVWRSHAQRARRAHLTRFRSRTPRPPSSVGRQTSIQATVQLPLPSSRPENQKNERWHLTLVSLMGFSMSMVSMVWIGAAASTDLTRTSLSPLDISPARHPESSSYSLSMRGCKSSAHNFQMERGTPR